LATLVANPRARSFPTDAHTVPESELTRLSIVPQRLTRAVGVTKTIAMTAEVQTVTPA